MDQSNQGVEVNEQAAPAAQTGVETQSSRAPEEDPEARIAALIAENAKLASDRDNYRQGLLVAKGKIDAPEMDLTDPTQIAEFIQQQVSQTLSATSAQKAQEDLMSYAKDLARKNKELTLALQNKAGMSASGQGSGSSDHSESQIGYFSKDQVADFKKKGWSDEKIKRAEMNMRKQ